MMSIYAQVEGLFAKKALQLEKAEGLGGEQYYVVLFV
jgi:hypothetical protein